jgi:hypothetical protein
MTAKSIRPFYTHASLLTTIEPLHDHCQVGNVEFTLILPYHVTKAIEDLIRHHLPTTTRGNPRVDMCHWLLIGQGEYPALTMLIPESADLSEIFPDIPTPEDPIPWDVLPFHRPSFPTD